MTIVWRRTGNLLPEVAAQLALLIDSLLNPKVNGADDPEDENGSARGGVRFEPSDEAEVRRPLSPSLRPRPILRQSAGGRASAAPVISSR